MIKLQVIAAFISGMIAFSGITTNVNAAIAYPGYIFTASGQNGYLINPSGTTVHTWKATSSARSNAYLLPDGSALFPIAPATACAVRSDGAYGHGRLQKISWDNKVVWDAVVCDATYTPGYDLEPMPNGNVLVAGASSTGGLKIVEVKPSGTSAATVAWSYNLPDSLGNTGYINSISYNPELDYIGININQAKKLVVIDHKGTGGIVYTYRITSGSATHGVMWVTKYFLGTNIVNPDADITAMRTNNLLVVNNSTQAVEVNPIAKTFVKNITFAFSDHEGSVQRLPNGNTLVNAANNKAVELDADGATVRTITLPGSVARAYMWGPGYPGLMTYSTGIKSKTAGSVAPGKFTYNSTAHTGKIKVANQKGAPLDIRIYTLSGKTVYTASSRGKEAVFSTTNLAAGIYHVEVQHASGSFRTSFVKMQ
jgi:hypothetical protein